LALRKIGIVTAMRRYSFEELGERIRALRSKHGQTLVGIDGGGGAGKSTFATHLQRAIPEAVIIHGDDFYTSPWDRRLDHRDYVVNPHFDWDRLVAEVFEPLKRGCPIAYHQFNWRTGGLNATVSVPLEATVILEGGAMTQDAFADFFDFKIWIDADEEVRLKRALERDGERVKHFLVEDWLPVQRNYMRVQNPAARADLIVHGQSEDFSHGFRVIESKSPRMPE
jgi:uridine kinase